MERLLIRSRLNQRRRRSERHLRGTALCDARRQPARDLGSRLTIMAHTCPDCGMLCYCRGDIDDCEFDGTPEQARCGHCADRDDEHEQEEPVNPDIKTQINAEQQDAILEELETKRGTPKRVCRICGKGEDEHPIWMTRGSWTHDAEWLPPSATGEDRT